MVEAGLENLTGSERQEPVQSSMYPGQQGEGGPGSSPQPHWLCHPSQGAARPKCQGAVDETQSQSKGVLRQGPLPLCKGRGEVQGEVLQRVSGLHGEVPKMCRGAEAGRH